MLTELLEARTLLSSSYQIDSLVSDGAVPAAHIDKLMHDPWGILMTSSGVRIVNNGTGTSTQYNGHGKPSGSIIDLPGGGGQPNAASGLIANTTHDFVISKDGKSAPAAFLSVGEDGAIVGYNGAVSSKGVIGVDGSSKGGVYKGVAMGNSGGKNYLYVANFPNKRVSVFNGKFQSATLKGDFKDPNLPSNYGPFNIADHDGHLFITFAETTKGSIDEVDGAHLGIIDEFNTDGTFVKRIATGGTLNAPWAMTFADQNFGGFVDAGDMLVGNFGDGRINVFSSSGHFKGQLDGSNGKALSIDGLWGIAFGNGMNGANSDRLYFAAGTNGEADGLFGYVHAGNGSSSVGGGGMSGGDGGDKVHNSIVSDVLG